MQFFITLLLINLRNKNKDHGDLTNLNIRRTRSHDKSMFSHFYKLFLHISYHIIPSHIISHNPFTYHIT